MKVYEIILGIILIGMTQLSQIPADIEVSDVVVESDYSDTEENNTATESDDSDTEISEAAIEADEQENMEWLESDEEWEDRRTKSNSTLEVTIERTDYSIYNEEGLMIAGIYYDRPVISGDSVAAEKITQFFDKEEQDWVSGTGRLVDLPGNSGGNGLVAFLDDVGELREQHGDEDTAEWLCLYSVEARIMYMDEDILSIMQIKEWRASRVGWNYFGCTFDLNTGELLKFTDLADISVEDLKNILSEVGYPDADNVLSDDYIIVSYRKEMDMAYQFCVDEKYLYLLDNTTKRYRDGMIYRVDETGEPVKLRCRVKREDHKNRIHSEIID